METKAKNKLKKVLGSVVVILLVLLLEKVGLITPDTETTNTDGVVVESNASSVLYEVVRVVDGDTIVINYNGVEEKVRLIGVDTPESVHPNDEKNTEEGIKTSDYTKQMLEGKQVSIELDVQERDKYGRILAYVYIDGEMYNKTLLINGYAKVATYPPNVKYVDDFIKLEQEARENKVGLWQED